MYGVRRLISSNSSISKFTFASLAIARKCKTALVEPPIAQTTVTAFFMDSLVIMSRGFIPKRSKFITADPAL